MNKITLGQKITVSTLHTVETSAHRALDGRPGDRAYVVRQHAVQHLHVVDFMLKATIE